MKAKSCSYDRISFCFTGIPVNFTGNIYLVPLKELTTAIIIGSYDNCMSYLLAMILQYNSASANVKMGHMISLTKVESVRVYASVRTVKTPP